MTGKVLDLQGVPVAGARLRLVSSASALIRETASDPRGGNHLPFHLQAPGEFEYVRAKPVGDRFIGTPVREIRGALLRPFLDNRMSFGGNFLLATGYTGQTTEIRSSPAAAPSNASWASR